MCFLFCCYPLKKFNIYISGVRERNILPLNIFTQSSSTTCAADLRSWCLKCCRTPRAAASSSSSCRLPDVAWLILIRKSSSSSNSPMWGDTAGSRGPRELAVLQKIMYKMASGQQRPPPQAPAAACYSRGCQTLRPPSLILSLWGQFDTNRRKMSIMESSDGRSIHIMYFSRSTNTTMWEY